MSLITNWLSGVKLTFTQWIGASAALVIGVLVAALRLQGTRLHRTQTELLAAQFGRTMDQQDAKVEAAKKAWQEALQAYEDAQ